ncbi:methyltransferase [Engelhardtia mirabilis]|uniref:Methyltransferase domain-containing protein n=1 Tax=Engelhardtia mirabilis TaxID=2528011 RepID=A0A518BKH2_9BACT|nr:hypothetical protein Pla133_25540 [Planctomycetes bacterium Pla133]QDV01797.1 hypothetical protein Pla86_25530 [Planctomycetes bacterium Pla86]
MSTFRLLRAFNQPGLETYAGSKTRVGRNTARHFEGEGLVERLVRELCAERALPIKELAEACEFFAVARKWLRTEVVVDFCAGHGLAGILFAVFQPETQRVVLCDRRQPESFEPVLRAALRAAPWIEGQVSYRIGRLERAREDLPEGASVIGVHACGQLTDACLDVAAGLGGPVAVLPCCRDHGLSEAPAALREALGEDVAYDVHRTYTMEARGYRTRWREIPSTITPMNRMLIGVPRGGLKGSGA